MKAAGSVGLALALLMTAPSYAQAPSKEDGTFQANRAASRFLAIAEICPALIPTDAAKARRYAENFMAVGKKFAGASWGAAIRSEIERRLAEVSITGEQRWCEDQRRYLPEVGERTIFPRAR